MYIQKVLVVVLVVLVCFMHRAWSQDSTTSEIMDTTTTIDDEDTTTTTDLPFTTCTEYEGTPLDLEPMKGYWYETARSSDVANMECMNISVPAKVNEDNKIDLRIEYVDTTDGKWQSAHKSNSFPWDENTQNGIFTWHIGEETKLPVTYKLISTDATSHAFFCGYSGIAEVPLFKVWSRKRHLSLEEKTLIEHKYQEIGQTSKIIWAEQSLEVCNSAMRSTGGALVALALAFLVYCRSI